MTWGMSPLHQQSKAGAKAPALSDRSAVDPEQKAQDIQFRELSEIKALREKVIANAQREGYAAGFEAAREEGHKEGYAAGMLASEADVREKTKVAVEPIRHLALGFATALRALDTEIGEQIAAVALKIGHQLALDALKASPESVVALVKAVLHSDPEMIGKPRLRANPEDVEMISRECGDEIEALGWKLIPDETISRGGCKVVSTSGEIDATWETRWAAVQKELQREKADP